MLKLYLDKASILLVKLDGVGNNVKQHFLDAVVVSQNVQRERFGRFFDDL